MMILLLTLILIAVEWTLVELFRLFPTTQYPTASGVIVIIAIAVFAIYCFIVGTVLIYSSAKYFWKDINK